MRDPALRWQAAADLKLELDEVAAGAGKTVVAAEAEGQEPPRPKRDIGRNLRRAPWWVLAIAVTGLLALAAVTARRFLPDSPAAIGSIAVLPFVHANNSPEIEYLSDGISESLINTLSQLPRVKVIARSSSFAFKGRETDIRQVARSLGVQALVTGRVVQSGRRLKVTAELVNGADGTEIWGEQYQRENADLLAVQAEISRHIADRLHATLPGEGPMVRRAGTKPEAYELLLRGRYQLRLYTPESTQKAVEYYQQAIAVDPSYALAHAELAYNYRLLSGAAILNPADMLPKAEAEALQALALDEGLAEAHSALADVERDLWHWTAAGREYRRALELNPNLADAHDGYALYLSVTGKHDEAIAEILRTRQLDPLKLLVALDVGTIYYNARDFRRALDAVGHALELDPAAPITQTWIGIVNGGMGRFDEALAAYEKAIAGGAGTATTRCLYAYSLARSGKQNRALEILAQLQGSGEFVPPAALAFIYAGLNRKDEAFRSLERAFEARDPLLQYLNVEPHYDVLRSDQRFQALLTKVGLPH
jgi:TolB-like protein/Tfp pilus assembly protein PilF